MTVLSGKRCLNKAISKDLAPNAWVGEGNTNEWQGMPVAITNLLHVYDVIVWTSIEHLKTPDQS